jgi:DNA invertase Pin-like site-specific DNA recombinase
MMELTGTEKFVGYVRVSRDDLNCENQTKVLKEWAERNNIKELPIFAEVLSSRKTRPIKEKVLANFRKGVFKTIVVVRIDRWARSLQELIYNVEEIINNGGRFISIINNFDFSKQNYNASQQLMLNIFGAFAQFEREIIRERTLEGLARAKANGVKLGRRKGSKVIPNSDGGFNVVLGGLK